MEKIHIHRLIQQQDINYESAYKMYGQHFDEKGMIDVDKLKEVE